MLALRKAVRVSMLWIDLLYILSNIGQLTEAVRRKPYGMISVFARLRLYLTTSLAVILLDELEKAHKVATNVSAPGEIGLSVLSYTSRMLP
jgi:hypothetical protein